MQETIVSSFYNISFQTSHPSETFFFAFKTFGDSGRQSILSIRTFIHVQQTGKTL